MLIPVDIVQYESQALTIPTERLLEVLEELMLDTDEFCYIDFSHIEANALTDILNPYLVINAEAVLDAIANLMVGDEYDEDVDEEDAEVYDILRKALQDLKDVGLINNEGFIRIDCVS